METTEKDPADIEEELLGMEQWSTDPGDCNRCVCNGQIFLIKNYNLC